MRLQLKRKSGFFFFNFLHQFPFWLSFYNLIYLYRKVNWTRNMVFLLFSKKKMKRPISKLQMKSWTKMMKTKKVLDLQKARFNSAACRVLFVACTACFLFSKYSFVCLYIYSCIILHVFDYFHTVYSFIFGLLLLLLLYYYYYYILILVIYLFIYFIYYLFFLKTNRVLFYFIVFDCQDYHMKNIINIYFSKFHALIFLFLCLFYLRF